MKCVSISDGVILYAATIEHGGLRDPVFASLEAPEPDEPLGRLSVHGIYRPRTEAQDAALRLPPELPRGVPAPCSGPRR